MNKKNAVLLFICFYIILMSLNSCEQEDVSSNSINLDICNLSESTSKESISNIFMENSQNDFSLEISSNNSSNEISTDNSQTNDRQIEIFSQEIDDIEYFGVKNRNGEIIIPAEYNAGIDLIGENRICAKYGWQLIEYNRCIIFDFKGNIICDKFNDIGFKKNENGSYYKYGIAWYSKEDNNYAQEDYLINQNGDIISDLDYYDYGFEDEETLWVQDTEESVKRIIKIIDLIT